MYVIRLPHELTQVKRCSVVFSTQTDAVLDRWVSQIFISSFSLPKGAESLLIVVLAAGAESGLIVIVVCLL